MNNQEGMFMLLSENNIAIMALLTHSQIHSSILDGGGGCGVEWGYWKLSCCLDCGRKLEYLERTQANVGRTCKLHTSEL